MTTDEIETVLGHVQYTARHFVAFRGTLDKMVELIRYSIGRDAPSAEGIARFLRMESTQRELETNWETAIWQSADISKSWRLICLAVPDNATDAAALLARKTPPNSCAFCWQAEPGWTKEILQPEIGVDGHPVANVYLHRQCQRPWRLLRDVVARNS